MAQFIARIQGKRGEASRLGSKNSGITAIVNGWNCGVRVEARHIDGEDVFDVYDTGGSNACGSDELLFTITETAIVMASNR